MTDEATNQDGAEREFVSVTGDRLYSSKASLEAGYRHFDILDPALDARPCVYRIESRSADGEWAPQEFGWEHGDTADTYAWGSVPNRDQLRLMHRVKSGERWIWEQYALLNGSDDQEAIDFVLLHFDALRPSMSHGEWQARRAAAEQFPGSQVFAGPFG